MTEFNEAARQPLSTRKKAPLKYTLLIGFAAVMLLGVGVFLLVHKNGQNEIGDQNHSALYVNRPGFDAKETGQAIGDPAPLTLGNSKDVAATYQNTKVIQACNILNSDDIKALGLKIFPTSSVGGVQRTFFDGMSQAALPSSPYSLPLSDTNQCLFQLQTPDKRVEINVYQSPYVPGSAVDYEVARYTKNDDAAGATVYSRASDRLTYYMIRKNNVAVQLITELNDANVAHRLVEKAAANLNQQLDAPTGVPALTYDSPLMKTYAHACEFLQPQDVTQLFGTAVSPLVNETIASAIGVITLTSKDDKQYLANYIDNDCTRSVIGDSDADSASTASVKLSTTTYKYAAAAHDTMTFLQQFNHGKAVSNVGDEAFSSEDENASLLTFRKGAVVYIVRIYPGSLTTSAAQQAALKEAQTLAARISN